MSGLESGWGLQVVLWLQAIRGPALELFAKAFNWLGQEDFFLILVPFIYWSIDALLGRQMFFLLVGSIWSNSALKAVFQRPRPFQVSNKVHNIIDEASYGLPSGHAQNSTVIAAPLAYAVKRWWFTALMVVYVLLMMISRVLAGVHFPQDVIGGLLIGLVIFGLYWVLERPINQSLVQMNIAGKIAFVVIVCAILYMIHPVLISVPPAAAEGTVSAIGILLGGGIGFILEARYVRFSAGGDATKRGARLVIGIIGLLIIRFGLKALFGNLEPVNLFRIIRYAMIGLWAAYGAPWVFIRFKLAEHRSTPDVSVVEPVNRTE